MNFLRKSITLTALLCGIIAFNSLAEMKNGDPYEPTRTTPKTEVKYEDKSLNYEWTWLSDELCVQYKPYQTTRRNRLIKNYAEGLLTPYRNDGIDQKRETYSGKWSQDADGTWSFEFDDFTTPVDIVRIDGVLYAFNGWGELREGTVYYGEQRPFSTEGCLVTGADGLVTSDDPEFLEWLSTQYLPDCESHE